MRMIGLDWGEKRIGVSVSDPLGITAQSLPYINNDSRFIEKLSEVIKEYNADLIVLGHPVMLSGKHGVSSEKVMLFNKMLNERLPIKISLWDERLTSKTAEKMLIGAGVSRKKRKKIVDSSSASFMLQNYMDHKKYEQRS